MYPKASFDDGGVADWSGKSSPPTVLATIGANATKIPPLN